MMKKPWIWRGRLDRLYWFWRFSFAGSFFYAIKTWIHLLWNARRTAIVLEECTRAMGLMDKIERKKNDPPDAPILWTMPSETRSELINKACWKALPRWQWRKDK